MASNRILLLILFAISIYTGVCEHPIELLPNEHPVIKYVDETLILSCIFMNNSTLKMQSPSHSLNSIKSIKYPKDLASHFISWTLPINGKGRVSCQFTANMFTLTLRNLRETDRGIYTCDVTNDLNATSKLDVEVVVLPRGIISHCNEDSFYCDDGLCIPSRYMCDGVSDCHDGSDETVTACGTNTCNGKLQCEDGRCMTPSRCCREKNLSPSNCTIYSTIQCCRQLLHPSVLDMDLYYLASRPIVQNQWKYNSDTTVFFGCFVVIANLITVIIIVSVRYYLWRNNNTSESRLSRIHPSRWNPFNARSFQPNITDQNHLRTMENLYSRRLPISDHRRDSDRDHTRGVLLLPLNDSQSLYPDREPPPSYHQIIGAPPPPYSSCDNVSLPQHITSVPLVRPNNNNLISSISNINNNIYNNNNNNHIYDNNNIYSNNNNNYVNNNHIYGNNNGDINGNNMNQVNVNRIHDTSTRPTLPAVESDCSSSSTTSSTTTTTSSNSSSLDCSIDRYYK